MDAQQPASHASCHSGPSGQSGTARRRWYRQPKQWVLRVVLPVLAAGLIWPPLRPGFETFLGYLRMTWWAMGLGLLIGGLVDCYVPREYVSKLLSESRPRTVLLSTVLGVLASGCSHGVLAMSMELHRKGAAPAAVVSFLLASPWASFSFTLVMFSLFGAKAFLVIGAALVVACLTGMAFLFLAARGWIERNPHTVPAEPGFSIREDIRRRAARFQPSARRTVDDARAVLRGAWNLADMVVWWLLIGFFLASVFGAYIPHEAFGRYFGPTLLGLLATLGLATVVEICSEGSAPMAFELYRHTGALGNSFAFLVGGVVTDVTELGLVWVNMGPRTALWLVAASLPQVLVLGFLLNRF